MKHLGLAFEDFLVCKKHNVYLNIGYFWGGRFAQAIMSVCCR